MIDRADCAARRAVTLIRGEETGGQLAVVALHEVQGQEPPRHVHANEDEIVCVLEGDVTFWIGADVRRAAAGICLFLPRGTEHGYAVVSGVARLLVVVTPAGSEELCGELDTSRGSVDLERLIAVAARYGTAITGPAPIVEESATGVTPPDASGSPDTVGGTGMPMNEALARE